MGKFPGVGTHKMSKCPGMGAKKEGKCPAPGIVAFQHFLTNQWIRRLNWGRRTQAEFLLADKKSSLVG